MTGPIYGPTDAARSLGITRSGVMNAVERGRLVPDWTTVGGRPLFSEATIESYRRTSLGNRGGRRS
jgi:hypothetical protein